MKKTNWEYTKPAIVVAEVIWAVVFLLFINPLLPGLAFDRIIMNLVPFLILMLGAIVIFFIGKWIDSRHVPKY